MNNPFYNSIVQHPVYHGSHYIFDKFEHSNDIGYHFGSELAGKHRMTHTLSSGGMSFDIEEKSPTTIDKERYKIEQGEYEKTLVDEVYKVLMQKLTNPSPNLYSKLTELSDEELHEILTEYRQKPNYVGYDESVKRGGLPTTYDVIVNGEVVFNEPTMRHANAKLIRLKEKYYRPRAFWVDLRNPLITKDLGTWSVMDIAKSAKLDNKTIESIFDLNDNSSRYDMLKKILKHMGYDGIQYTNEVEDTGSTSYIVFDSEQIQEINNSKLESTFINFVESICENNNSLKNAIMDGYIACFGEK